LNVAVVPFRRPRRDRRVELPAPETVPCPRCGAAVDGVDIRCSACGVNFTGSAAHLVPVQRPVATGRRVAAAVLAGVLLIAAIGAAVAVLLSSSD
jgi:hypothetical protein